MMTEGKKNKYFFINADIPRNEFFQKLSPHTKLIYYTLCSFRGGKNQKQKNKCWPSYVSLIKYTGMGRTNLSKGLAELEKAGLIFKKKMQSKTNGKIHYNEYSIIENPMIQSPTVGLRYKDQSPEMALSKSCSGTVTMTKNNEHERGNNEPLKIPLKGDLSAVLPVLPEKRLSFVTNCDKALLKEDIPVVPPETSLSKNKELDCQEEEIDEIAERMRVEESQKEEEIMKKKNEEFKKDRDVHRLITSIISDAQEQLNIPGFDKSKTIIRAFENYKKLKAEREKNRQELAV